MKKLKEFNNLIKKSNLSNHLEVISHISDVIEYEKHEKHEILFRQGEIGSKFYVILRGSVSILIPKEIDVLMSESEYLNYLIQLRTNKEKDLFSKVKEKNKNTFFFGEIEKEFLMKEKNLPSGFNRKMTNNFKFTQIKDLAETLINLMKSNIQNSTEVVSISTENFIERLKPLFDEDFKGERKKVTIYEYYKIVSLHTGNKFGDRALSAIDKKRLSQSIILELLL